MGVRFCISDVTPGDAAGGGLGTTLGAARACLASPWGKTWEGLWSKDVTRGKNIKGCSSEALSAASNQKPLKVAGLQDTELEVRAVLCESQQVSGSQPHHAPMCCPSSCSHGPEFG